MASTYRGAIDGFSGSWESGLAYLIVDGVPVPCDNGATARALDDCFGDVICEGHFVDSERIQGREIIYSVDGFGLLLGFTPVEDWDGPQIPPEGLHEED